MTRLIDGFEQFFDGAGNPLVSGELNFFESGSSTVRKTTFSDSGETIPNSNPVILGGDGRAPNVFGSGSYRVVLTDSDEVQIIVRDPIGGDLSSPFGADWSADVTYSVSDVVRDDGKYYESLINNNTDNRPSIAAGAWREAIITAPGVVNLSGQVFDTVADMAAVETPIDLTVGRTKGSATAGDQKGGMYLFNATSSTTEDGKRVIAPSGGVGRWLLINDVLYSTLLRGDGVKGNPQTNVGFQVHRDITSAGASSHGFNCADYFADDTQAMNVFGSDIQVGDGTQTTEVLNHLNSFQSTNQIDLNTGELELHNAFIAQDVLVSGQVSRSGGLVVVDLLGVRDTPGFGVLGFDPASVSNNATGVACVIRHGANPKSFHAQAGSTDAGALLTSGGAPSDFECPVLIRQADASTSKTTGALILTAGGIGCDGSIFAGDDVSANSATPSITLRSDAGTLLGGVSHDVTNMDVVNEFGATLRLGVSGTNVVELLSDRFRPVDDGAKFLGDASHRWDTVYATTGTINTSDENEKDVVGNIDDALLDAWGNVQHYLFKWKSSASKKGGEARTHAGHIAQQVRDSLSGAGIDGFSYGLLCEDELFAPTTKTRRVDVVRTEPVEIEREKLETIDGKIVRTVETVTESRPVMELLEVLNSDGTPYIVDGSPVARSVPVIDAVDQEYSELEATGEHRMGLRYDQCMIVEAAYLRREIGLLKD